MADPGLKLKLGVDDDEFKDKLDDAGKKITDLGKKVKNLKSPVDNAGASLVNLGRIASDLPFGFIAIQNNLDPLIQSFGSLSRSSGGVGGALKALGSALAGPAGIALAFSVVSSAVTFAIQKYGSLGNAISAILGRNTSLIESVNAAEKSYQKFNETVKSTADIASESERSASGQIVQVKALIEVINSSNESYERRSAALEALKKINKDWFGALDLEKLKVGDLEAAYKGYVAQIISAAKAKGFQDELSRTNTELDKQQKLLGDLVDARNKARQEDRAALARQQANAPLTAPVGLVTTPREAVGLLTPAAQKAVENQLKRVGELSDRVRDLENSITDTTKSSLNFKIEQDKLGGSTKGSAAAAKAAAAENARLARDQEKAQKAAEKLRLEQERLQEAFKRLAAPRESDLDITDQFRQENPEPVTPPARPFTNLGLIQGRLELEAADKAQQKFKDGLLSVVDTFNDLLAPAINTVFGALENGQNVFKAIGQALKALIVQLVATVVKAAALAAILSLIPGAGAALGVAGAAGGGTGNFLGIFRNFLPGGAGTAGLRRASAPTFTGGSNISPSGLQLAGQVVFVQRGPDLVGVLNQGNARIGRVG